MPARNRLLALMRHAKAEPFAAQDRLRALTPRGSRDAADAGRWLREQGVLPDTVLVSSAVRTRQTWAAVADGLATDLDAGFDDTLYGGGIEGALACVRAVPEDAGCVLVVGHNPTMAYLAQVLGDGTGDADALRLVGEGFPTAAVAVFEVPEAWAALDLGSCRLRAAYVGRG